MPFFPEERYAEKYLHPKNGGKPRPPYLTLATLKKHGNGSKIFDIFLDVPGGGFEHLRIGSWNRVYQTCCLSIIHCERNAALGKNAGVRLHE